MFRFDQKAFFNSLAPTFANELYTHIPAKLQFRHESPDGFKNVIVYPAVYEDRVVFEVTFGVRFNLVEDTMYQFTNGLKMFQPDSNTAIVNYGNYIKKPYYRMNALTQEEVLIVSEEIQNFFKSAGFDFLNKLSSLQQLDHLINSSPNQKSKYTFNQVTRCFRGLTIARLCDNREYDVLCKAYQKTIERENPPEDTLKRFNSLRQYLESFSFN